MPAVMSAPVLRSAVDPAGQDSARHTAAHRELVADLRKKLAAARLGGPERARIRHVRSHDERFAAGSRA